MALALGFAHLGSWTEVAVLPVPPPTHLYDAPVLVVPRADLSLYEMSVMEGWIPTDIFITGEEVRTDVSLWRDTFFQNWDRLPDGIREQGLAAMQSHFRRALKGPQSWERMTAETWDGVPQPLRAMAVLAMIDCWQRRYNVGERFRLPPARVTRRLSAIAIVESFFQHRASSGNPDGSSDIGIGQASAAARSRIRVLYVRGLADFGLSEDDYLDPWRACRALVFWFSLLLDEAGGNLDLATRAYNVGAPRARSGEGEDYLQAVLQREDEYLRANASSPSWRWLRHQTATERQRAAAAEGCAASTESGPERRRSAKRRR